MKKLLAYILITFQIFLVGNLGLFFGLVGQVHAEIGDIGHWRDSVGGQIPGTGFAGFDFNQEIRNDGIYSKPASDTIELDEAGDYLIIATTRDEDNSNGRYNSQLRVSQTAGAGELFTSHYSGYSRDNSENESWTRAISVVIGASANSQIQVQKRRDSDVPTGGSVANASDVQVIRLSQSNYGIYGIGGTGNNYGGTTPNTVDIDSVVSESDVLAIQGNTTTDTVTLRGDNKKYLIAWSTSFDGTGNRTQRIGHLEYDGSDELSTRTYCYRRNNANEYCGLGSMDVVETTTPDIAIQAEIFRGPGVAADQGGANADSTLSTDGNGQMIILEMPDYLEVFRSEDSVGLQDVTTAQTLNIARDVNFNDALSFTKNSDSEVSVTNPADIFSWANIWTAREDVASGARQTSFGSITIDGVEQSVGRHGNYSRGNQATTDTFAMGFQPAGIYTTSGAGATLGVNTDPLAGGEAGGNDRTQPGTLGFFAINLDTLIAPELDQSAYRVFGNIDSSDVGAALAAQDTAATLSVDGAAFRLRSLISVTQNKLRQNETNFKLQFAQRVGACDAGFVGESYVDVTTSTAIAFNNNTTPNDEDSLTANANDPVNGATPVVNQTYQELNNFTTSVAAIPEDEDGKWDFSLIDNTAPADTAYCFRMVESDGTLLDNYGVIPEITTSDTPVVGPIGPGGVDVNLSLWLRADRGTSTTIDGLPLATWNDQSPNGLNATAVTSPDYRASSLNFNPTIDFNGIDDYMNNTNNGSSSDSYYLVVVPDDEIDGTVSGQVPFGWNCNSGSITPGTCGLDFAGTVLGSFTIALPDEVITHALGSGTRWRSSATGDIEYPSGKPMIISVNENATANGTDIYEKGKKIDDITTNPYQVLSAADYTLGRSGDDVNTFFYDGKIAEVINYSSRSSDSDRAKIESYLALKYGSTLNSGTQNYIASDGTTTMWDTTTAGDFTFNVFGIGRDDNSDLTQIRSTSTLGDGILTIEADGEGSNQAPAFVDIIDKEFFTVSNGNSSNNWSDVDAPSTYSILSRQWRAQETGEVGNMTFEFQVDDPDFNIPALNAGTVYYFVYDSDSDGFLNDETPIAMTNSSGTIWEISGMNINDGQNFTIATESGGNNIPTDITLSNDSINENVTAGSTIGTFSTTDIDPDTHTYTLVGGSNSIDNVSFSITGNTLWIIESPDHEIKSEYFIRVETDDGNGGKLQEEFIITINDLGEAITTNIDLENANDETKYRVTSGQWNRTGTRTNSGSFALESDNLGAANSQSCFQIKHDNSATGSLNFFYNVSSEPVNDFLNFSFDGVEQQRWSGEEAWNDFTLNDITPGLHTYRWCYIKNNATNTGLDTAFIDDIVFSGVAGDITAPTIDSTNFASGSLLPGGNHTISLTYSDAESGIDDSSDSMTLHKWDGISAYGPDISGTGLTTGTINTSGATYTTNDLDFGKYQYRFSIDDNDGNTQTQNLDFYIDIPEFTISTGSIDMGSIDSISETFSPTVTITVRTVGAGFDVTMDSDDSLVYSPETIDNWDGMTGYGYDQVPYSGTIAAIGTNQSIAIQGASINTNGDKNTYTYDIRLGALVDAQQTAGEYIGNIDFDINLTY